MKGNANCRNWGGLEGSASPKVTRKVSIRWSTYDFLFEFNTNYLVPFSSDCKLFVKSRLF